MALAGVIFSVVIIFMQLGIQDALFKSAVRLYEALQGDVFLISPRTTAIIRMEKFTEHRLYQALAFKEVDFVSPIYLEFPQWRNPQRKNYWRTISLIGIDLRYPVLNLPGVQENLTQLNLEDKILFDIKSRKEFGDIASEFEPQKSIITELSYGGQTRKVEVVGLFEMGTSFGYDGSVLTSHLNFFRIITNRPKDFVDLGLIKLKPGTDVKSFVTKLKEYYPDDVRVFSKEELIKFEQNYWSSSTPIGFVFGLGVSLGLIVGMVVVYQILYTNISEHLSEYATLKAIGYHHQYLLSMVLQQAVLIAILGFIPGFLITGILYEYAKSATLLPFAFTFNRTTFVLSLTVMMCIISGAMAIKKLEAADPADIF